MSPPASTRALIRSVSRYQELGSASVYRNLTAAFCPYYVAQRAQSQPNCLGKGGLRAGGRAPIDTPSMDFLRCCTSLKLVELIKNEMVNNQGSFMSCLDQRNRYATEATS